jgi:arsenate reductase (thioredoxin)
MTDRPKIAFVCLHGSAKSLIAAEFCKRLAGRGGTTLDATTSGPEPDTEIPGNVIEGLLSDDIDVRGQTPQRVSAAALADAAHIVSFGCDLAAIAPKGVPIDRWDDCPAVSDDYGVARTFIVGRIERLLQRIPLK